MALTHMRNGRAPVIKLAHSFTALGSSNLPPLASLSAAAVKNTLPISAASHSLAPMYLPWVCTNKGGVRFNNKRKAQDLFLQLAEATQRYFKSKLNLAVMLARFSDTSLWCMRNIDANPTARRKKNSPFHSGSETVQCKPGKQSSANSLQLMSVLKSIKSSILW